MGGGNRGSLAAPQSLFCLPSHGRGGGMGKKGPLTVPLIPWRTISGQNNPEESSTPIGGQGQERLIGGIFNGETCPPGGGDGQQSAIGGIFNPFSYFIG